MKEKVKEMSVDGRDAIVVVGGKGLFSKMMGFVMVVLLSALPEVVVYFSVEMPGKTFVLIFVPFFLVLSALGIFVLLLQEMEMTLIDGGDKLGLHKKTPFGTKDIVLEKKAIGAFMIRPCRIGFRYNLVLECVPNEQSILPRQFPVGYAYWTTKEFKVISTWLQVRVEGIRIQSAH